MGLVLCWHVADPLLCLCTALSCFRWEQLDQPESQHWYLVHCGYPCVWVVWYMQANHRRKLGISPRAGNPWTLLVDVVP